VIVVVPTVVEIVAAPPRTTPSTGPACAQAANNKPGNVNFNEPMDRSRKLHNGAPGPANGGTLIYAYAVVPDSGHGLFARFGSGAIQNADRIV
jgi:hypothetical protein